MMATDSIRERILQNRKAALALINGTGDYHIALGTVARSQEPPSNLDALPAAHLTEGDEEVTEGPHPLVTRMLAVIVRGWIMAADAYADMELATLENRLLADIERAMLTEPTCGGLANIVSLTGSVINPDDEKDLTGNLSAAFLIQYQTQRDDPASL